MTKQHYKDTAIKCDVHPLLLMDLCSNEQTSSAENVLLLFMPQCQLCLTDADIVTALPLPTEVNRRRRLLNATLQTTEEESAAQK